MKNERDTHDSKYQSVVASFQLSMVVFERFQHCRAVFLVPNQNKGTEREHGNTFRNAVPVPLRSLLLHYGNGTEREHGPKPFRNRARPCSIYTQSELHASHDTCNVAH